VVVVVVVVTVALAVADEDHSGHDGEDAYGYDYVYDLLRLPRDYGAQTSYSDPPRVQTWRPLLRCFF
jgi:hypothetical protein